MRKPEVTKIVKKHMPWLLEVMGLEDRKIIVKVLHSKSKSAFTIPNHEPDAFAYVVDTTAKEPVIVIFYNELHTEKAAFTTLVHELFHVLLEPITKYIPNRLSPHETDERLVRKIEAVVAGVYDMRGKV